jgi:hypothetical protein
MLLLESVCCMVHLKFGPAVAKFECLLFQRHLSFYEAGVDANNS